MPVAGSKHATKVCKNGVNCCYLAQNRCWFQHPLSELHGSVAVIRENMQQLLALFKALASHLGFSTGEVQGEIQLPSVFQSHPHLPESEAPVDLGPSVQTETSRYAKRKERSPTATEAKRRKSIISETNVNEPVSPAHHSASRHQHPLDSSSTTTAVSKSPATSKVKPTVKPPVPLFASISHPLNTAAKTTISHTSASATTPQFATTKSAAVSVSSTSISRKPVPNEELKSPVLHRETTNSNARGDTASPGPPPKRPEAAAANACQETTSVTPKSSTSSSQRREMTNEATPQQHAATAAAPNSVPSSITSPHSTMTRKQRNALKREERERYRFMASRDPADMALKEANYQRHLVAEKVRMANLRDEFYTWTQDEKVKFVRLSPSDHLRAMFPELAKRFHPKGRKRRGKRSNYDDDDDDDNDEADEDEEAEDEQDEQDEDTDYDDWTGDSWGEPMPEDYAAYEDYDC